MQETFKSAFKAVFPAQRGKKVRPSLVVGSLLALILCASLSIATSYILGASQQEIVSAESIKKPVKTQTVSESASTSQPAAGATTQANGPVQTCVPAAGEAQPAGLSLGDTPDGLKQQIDSPQHYQIYGNSLDTLRSQVMRCAPKPAGSNEAKFTAQTMYKLNWQYSYGNDGGLCRITQASVGVHVSQIMPLWHPAAGTPVSAQTSWNAFMDALTTHENGHTALNVQYAQRLLSDLRNFPPTPCGQLPGAVKQLTDQDVAELAQANDNYDSTTNHGATQGAILP